MTTELLKPGLEFEIETPKVETIAPNGLGYGEGAISAKKRLESGDLSPDIVSLTEKLIRSPEAIVAIDEDVKDDGCGDGRGVCKVMKGETELGESLHRPKIFGGGTTMAAASIIGTDSLDRTKDSSMVGIFEQAIEMLDAAGIDYGAHTSDHATKDKTDCGAIDKSPSIIANAIEYQNEIKENLDALFDPNDIGLSIAQDLVFDNFKDQADDLKKGFSPKSILKKIFQRDKIVKELTRDHREIRIAVNIDIENCTTNQGLIREKTDDQAQVFVVDVPRMKEIAVGIFPKDVTKQKQALVSMMVYTLSTAATLTDGTLPVDIIYQDKPYIAF